MGLDGVSPTALVFPLLNFTFGIIQTGFELGSAPAETTSLIKTIEQVSTELKSAYRIQKFISQKDDIDIRDLNRIDEAIKNTEDAVYDVQALAERARVDMSTRYGKLGTRSRILWVVRDSKKVQTALMRLAIANACLKSSIDEASRQQVSTAYTANYARGNLDSWQSAADAFYGIAPPAYEEATKESMYERRRFKDQRNSFCRSPNLLSKSDPPSPVQLQRNNIYRPARSAASALSHLDDLRGYVQDNEEMLQSAYPNPSPGQSDQVVIASLGDSTTVHCDLRPCFELEAFPASTPVARTDSTSAYQPYTQVVPSATTSIIAKPTRESQAPSVPGPLSSHIQTSTQWQETPALQASPAKPTLHTKPLAPYPRTGTSLSSSPSIQSSFASTTVLSEPRAPPYPIKKPLRSSLPPTQPPQVPPARPQSFLRPSARSLSDLPLDLSHPSQEGGKPPHEPPSAWRAKDTPRMPKSPMATSNSMKSEAWIPGQKKPMQIRWKEPDDDDDENRPLKAASRAKSTPAFSGHDLGGIIEEQPPSLPDPYADATAPTEQALNSKPSRRRRPARFASGAINLPGPATSAPIATPETPAVIPRRDPTRKRQSRSEWLVEQSTGADSLI